MPDGVRAADTPKKGPIEQVVGAVYDLSGEFSPTYRTQVLQLQTLLAAALERIKQLEQENAQLRALRAFAFGKVLEK